MCAYVRACVCEYVCVHVCVCVCLSFHDGGSCITHYVVIWSIIQMRVCVCVRVRVRV